MRVIERQKVPKREIGRITIRNIYLEDHEEKTIRLLAGYGFGIEVIKPNNTPKTHSPDLLMLGTIWEMKAPTSTNVKTIKKRMHKASLQASHIIFDLRGISPSDCDEVEKEIVHRFEGKGTLKRMLIITASGKGREKLLDYIK